MSEAWRASNICTLIHSCQLSCLIRVIFTGSFWPSYGKFPLIPGDKEIKDDGEYKYQFVYSAENSSTMGHIKINYDWRSGISISSTLENLQRQSLSQRRQVSRLKFFIIYTSGLKIPDYHNQETSVQSTRSYISQHHL